MKVKKYVVDSLPQAMGQIKTELGNDAMILHTKKIKIGGFLGFFAKEKIEVIAAVDNSNQIDNNISVAPKNIDENHNSAPIGVTATTHTINKAYKAYSEVNNSVNSQTAVNSQTVDSSLKSEVSELKTLMVKMMMNQPDSDNTNGYSKQVRAIYDRLITQGINQELATKIIEKALSDDATQSLDEVSISSAVKNELFAVLNKNSAEREIKDSTKIVHFVGPTGVGKTTSIAKLAAERVLKHKKKVAFITADTYRIGAVEQLRTYADILHCPIEVVFSPQDTLKAIDKLKDYDLIFMDTAGRNYHNEMYISELNKILAKDNTSETYLVLSLTHKFDDMISILEQFKKVNIDKLLFTKYDETLTYGSILNILAMYPYGVSYITNGQNVPDDIEILNDEKIINSILGV